jgi:hypothetical protein
MADVKSVKVKLDWSRLLGFDQAADERETTAKFGTRLGSKIGGKPGVKTAPR